MMEMNSILLGIVVGLVAISFILGVMVFRKRIQQENQEIIKRIMMLIGGILFVALLIGLVALQINTAEPTPEKNNDKQLPNSSPEAITYQVDYDTNEKVEKVSFDEQKTLCDEPNNNRNKRTRCSSKCKEGTSTTTSEEQEVTWEEVYSYSDEYSEGGFFIDEQNDEIEVSRAYVWKAEFGTLFNGIIQVVSSNDKYSWYGSRLAIVNPENILERYEVRLLPGEDKLEVKYVDRTNRDGNLNGIEPETISEQLTITSCNIDTESWYNINIINLGSVWKAQLISLTNPTCFVEWEDSRISADKYGVGIQSAGKYVTSRFDKILIH